ncbi:MAG: AMP-binding protein [Burkholderiaceae bacterium]|nr:AMP-binding protein [Burkholderiaceae bacterium]MCD8517600.1 AMP-binding protein [Burkholderiaceae bacterium]MCD8537394.1 AMP-binding protein [Burkholderiaceae bacterium]MCD8565552.1 AMP-binding protein [Burkholderiaceae bacterium]
MVESYPELYEAFRWHVPKDFNLARACCFQWSSLPGYEQRPALIYESRLGHTEMTSFAELGAVSSQLANGLIRLGVIPGDRVVVMLSNPSDTLTALLACWAIRAVAVPMKPGSSAEVLLPHIKQARSQVALIDACNQGEALAAIARCPRIKHIVGIDVYDGRVMSWRGLIARQPTLFAPTQSVPSDPAVMVWPEHPSPDLAPQAAMVLAHQSLIGQLPGFVMAANWFPENAKQLLTTLKPWDESGLMAAILPALYFGHTVVLANRLPNASNLPRHITHIVTTGKHLIETIKSDPNTSTRGTALAALTVLDHTLASQWRVHASNLYGTEVNLATFVSGCGLLIAQSQRKWPEPADSCGHLVPGHKARLLERGSGSAASTDVRELEVSRVDIAGQTDPAQFIQAWPVKDQLDLSAELPTWWRTGLSAQTLPEGHWRVLGHAEEWQMIAGKALNLWQLEQTALTHPEIRWAEAAFIPCRKSQPEELEIWMLLDAGTGDDHTLKPWRQTLRTDIINRILTSTGLDADAVKFRVGLVDRNKVQSESLRAPWHMRAYQALVDFL